MKLQGGELRDPIHTEGLCAPFIASSSDQRAVNS